MVKRAPFVIGATGVSSSAGASPNGSSGSPTSSTTTAPSGSAASTPATPSTTAPGGAASGPTTPSTASPTTVASKRDATGQFIQYMYGDIQVKVTKQGTRITNIQVLKEDATDPRSAQINSIAIPMLQQQAMSAQSANINGVSGATFTSQAYYEALQSALDKLK
jgi:uncharacterized protein with FMN-binding domain